MYIFPTFSYGLILYLNKKHINSDVYFGGPVSPDKGFILHDGEYNEDGTIDGEGEIDDLSFGLLVGFSSLTNLVALTELVEMPKGSGINKEYYENRIIKEEISYKDGKLNGVSKEYYENGSLKSESTFKDGVLDGKVIEYYPK